MNPTPLVSVVLPVYNGGAALRMAVTSICLQTLREWELLILDDGSTDDCVAGLNLPDGRIRVIRDGKNLGLAARLNQGIDLAKGKYFARMDQDDVAYPARLERQVEFLERNPDIDLVGTKAIAFRSEGIPVGLLPFRATHSEICAHPWNGFYLPHPTWMGRIEWFRHHRYAMPELVRAEDQDLLLRTYDCSRFACIDEVLLGYKKELMPLGKLWTARVNVARSQLRRHIAKGRWLYAALGCSASLLKGLFDLMRRPFQSADGEPISGWTPLWGSDVEAWCNVWDAIQSSIPTETTAAREGQECQV
jgi:glycosyltransferase involved in cell wall biosynthesis